MPVRNITLIPMGDGKKSLPVQIHSTNTWPGASCRCREGGEYPCVGARLDWYNDELQAIVDDAGAGGDPAIHCKFKPDGTVSKILIRRDLRDKVKFE